MKFSLFGRKVPEDVLGNSLKKAGNLCFTFRELQSFKRDKERQRFPMEWLLCGQPVISFMRRPNPPMSCRSDIVGGGGGRREVLVLMRADVTRCQLPRSRGFTAPLTRRGQFTAGGRAKGGKSHNPFLVPYCLRSPPPVGSPSTLRRPRIDCCTTFKSWVPRVHATVWSPSLSLPRV